MKSVVAYYKVLFRIFLKNCKFAGF